MRQHTDLSAGALWGAALAATAVLAAAGAWASARAAEPAAGPAAAARAGNQVAYQLPTDGALPRTYRVTLAIVDPKDPNWIIDQFVAGADRTVSADNAGRFVETWDGLDDNFMPVPPGTYAARGIYMPAEKWAVDGEYHSVTPQFVTGASAWCPTADQAGKPEPFGGDPCGAPLGDVAVGPDGLAVFYYVYLENGLNNAVVDLNKPVGYAQFVRAYNSGGAGGGPCTTTDGQTIWSFSTDGGPKFVYRADGKPFGTGNGQRRNVYRPAGWVTAMACWRDAEAKSTSVFVAERGRIVEAPRQDYVESTSDPVDKVVVLAGETGATLAELPLRRPQGLAAQGATLYALHATDAGGWAVSTVALEAGRPKGMWRLAFSLPAGVRPFGLAVDSHGRLYVSDSDANKVHQYDRSGRLLLSFGRLAAQKPGAYDPQSFIAPGKLATWTDAGGHDRLIVVERGGPNRASEWNDDGKLIREFLSLQTKANDGYAADPLEPGHIYIAGQEGWLTRFRVDYASGAWTVDAVWPNVGTDPNAPGFDHPRLINLNGRKYLACERSYNVFRLDGERWVLSAAIVRKREGNKQQCFLWHDDNGDGRVQESEYRGHPLTLPGHMLRYHGERWLDDLSLVAINQAGPDVWRLAPERFDERGNPIFGAWRRVLTDPVFAARAAGTADAVHGGNEMDDRYSSDWAMADGTVADGFYVQARGGHSFSANEGSQMKLSRYVPDGRGGYRLKWRTGRQALGHVARPAEVYGAIHINRPINGLLSVIDQSRCGVLLYTADGLYVDTIFPDGRRFSPARAGMYVQPGEFFAGNVFANTASGKVYFQMGKYTPTLYEARGWSLTESPVRPLKLTGATVSLSAAQIAAPPEIALSVRGGAGVARLVRFAPALGGAVLDGSMAGWESCPPVQFQADKDQSVEVRCLYDPDHLYLRWHARLSGKFEPKALEPIERIFTHDRLADTLSFYLQADPSAAPAAGAAGRAGDVRIVFGVFRDGQAIKPVALGMYPKWAGPGSALPQVYRTPVGEATFAHVAPLAGVQLGWRPDADGKGFVLAAGIPRSAVAPLPPLAGGLRTLANFEATFAGHNKFWWANRDGSASRETYDEPTESRLYAGSWAPAEFLGLDGGVVVRNWLICGPWGGPETKEFHHDLGLPGEKERARRFCEAAVYPPDNGKVDPNAVFKGPANGGYWGDGGAVRWKPAATADLDTRVILGPSAQVWYGATWIHAAGETELDFQFQGHPQTYLRFFLNGTRVYEGEIKDKSDRPVAAKKLTLRRGWNQVTFRGYCTGYPPFRTGLVLAAPPEKLWSLRLSASPPPAE